MPQFFDDNTVEKHGEFDSINFMAKGARIELGYRESPDFEALTEEAKPAFIVEQDFAAVVAFVEKDEEISREGVFSKIVSDFIPQAFIAKSHVGGLPMKENAKVGCKAQHEAVSVRAWSKILHSSREAHKGT
jgi:hypothetical protein